MSRPLLPEVAPGRVVGVDVARALALVGMMATHMLPGLVGTHVPWAQQVAGGRASALFAVLAGVSVALVSGRTRPVRGRARYAVSTRLVVRSLVIGALGLTLGLVPTGIAVILAYYAVLFLLGLPFLGLRAPALALLAGVWAVAGPALSLVLRPHLPHHEVGSPTPASLTSPLHLLNELLFVGYYPAAVWLAYLLAGMAIGRADLLRRGVDVVLLVGGVGVAVAGTVLSRVLLSRDDACGRPRCDLPGPGGGAGPGPLGRHPDPRSARHDADRLLVVAGHGRATLRDAPRPGPDDRQCDGGARAVPAGHASPAPGLGRGLRRRGDDPEPLHAARPDDGRGLVARPRGAGQLPRPGAHRAGGRVPASPWCRCGGPSRRWSPGCPGAAAAPWTDRAPSTVTADRAGRRR